MADTKQKVNFKTMAKKKVKEEEEKYSPIYVQSSNPSKKLLDWIAEMSETRIVYLQSGNPPPPKCPPGQICND